MSFVISVAIVVVVIVAALVGVATLIDSTIVLHASSRSMENIDRVHEKVYKIEAMLREGEVYKENIRLANRKKNELISLEYKMRAIHRAQIVKQQRLELKKF